MSKTIKTKRPQWQITYYVLAAFNTAAILLSLSLTRDIMLELDSSMTLNYTQNHYLDEITKTQSQALKLTQPATRVFFSQDIPLERRLLNTEVALTKEKIQQLKDKFRDDPHGPALLSSLTSFEQKLAHLITMNEQVFVNYEQNNMQEATATLAELSELSHIAFSNFDQIRTLINTSQLDSLNAVNAKVKKFKRYIGLLFLSVFTLIIAITLYGRKLAQKLRRDEVEKQALLKATRNNALMLNTILESTVDGIITYDNQGVIVSANNAAEHIFGRDRDEMIGASALSILAADKSSKYTKALQDELQSLHSQRVVGLRVSAQHKNGTVFPISVSINSREHTQVDGTRQRLFTAIIRDITTEHEQKQALETALQNAKSASIAKDEFLATVSHEIRTPMNGIIGASELLYNTELETEQTELVDIIHNSSNALLAIINDILEFSRIQSGNVELESIAFNANSLVEDVYNLLKNRAHKQSLQFTITTADDTDYSFLGDPTRIRQILLNLINNAIKFTQAGKVTIHHDTVQTNNNTIWRCQITDTGIGIKEDELSKLFQRFSQADSSTTRNYGGTGLGLAISQQLAQLMNGNISVTSTYGQGSTFTLELPLTPTKPVVNKPLRGRPTRNYGKQVLLVEDNKVNQLIASRLLQSFGLYVTIAEDGKQALAQLDQSPFDLVFMDMQMPVMDGISATKNIRSSSAQYRDIPIVAMTANALDKDRHACFEAGMNDFLSKPLEPSGIITALDNLFQPEAGLS